MPPMPVEWLDAGSWRLPSGKALAEFALQAGFLAPLLFRADRLGKDGSGNDQFGKQGAKKASEASAHSAITGRKHFEKGEGR